MSGPPPSVQSRRSVPPRSPVTEGSLRNRPMLVGSELYNKLRITPTEEWGRIIHADPISGDRRRANLGGVPYAYDVNVDGYLSEDDDFTGDGVIDDRDYRLFYDAREEGFEVLSRESLEEERRILQEREQQVEQQREFNRQVDQRIEALRQEAAENTAAQRRQEGRRARVEEIDSAIRVTIPEAKSNFAFDRPETLETLETGRFSIATNNGSPENNAFISPLRPEIVSKISLHLFKDYNSLSSLHELRQFEKHLRIESLDKDWSAANSALTPEISTEIERLQTIYESRNRQYHDALCRLKNTMDSISFQIDLKKNSSSIAQFAKDSASALLDVREGDFSNGLDSIENFLKNYCGYEFASHFSSTKMFYLLLREFSNAARRHSPELLSSRRARKDFQDRRPFIVDEYLPESELTHRLSVHAIGTRDITNTIFSDGTASAAAAARRCVTRPYRNVLQGISSVESSADRIKVISVLLHNELSISSGIGRLNGTAEGNFFGVTGGDPLVNILGGYFVDAFSVISGKGKPNSYADLAVLNEQFGSQDRNSATKILPFESNIVVDSAERSLIPGRIFFVEQMLTQDNLATPLTPFAKKFSDVNSAAQFSLKSLLTFDKECKFLPSDIVIECLKIISGASRRLLDPEASFSEVLPLIAISHWNDTSAPSENRRSGIFPGTNSKVIDALFASCAFRRSIRDQNNLLQENPPDVSHVPTVSFPATFAGRLARTIEDFAQISMEDLKFRPESGLDQQTLESQTARFNSDIKGYGDKIDSFVLNSFYHYFSNAYPLVPAANPKMTFFDGQTILDSIALLLRDIQRKVSNLRTSEEKTSSYLDDDGLTRFNRWDDNTMLACFFEIIRCLAGELIDIKRDDILRSDENRLSFQLRLTAESRANIEKLVRFIDASVATYEQNNSVKDLFDFEGNARAVLGVSQNTSFKTRGMTAGQIVEIITSVIEHRKFMKLSLGFLDAVSKNFNNSSDQLTTFLNSTQASGNIADVLGEIRSNSFGKRALETLNSEQNSLRKFQIERNVSSGKPSGLSVSTFSTSQEDEVQEFFIEEMSKFSGENNVALLVGLPAALIKNLHDASQNETDQVGIPNTQQNNSLISLNFHRVNEVSQGESVKLQNADILSQTRLSSNSFQPAHYSVKFDPELFILPGSLRFSLSDITGGATKSMQSLVEGTLFTRIRNGLVVESQTGKIILRTRPRFFEVLKNHVVDRIFKLFSHSIFGVRLEDDLWLERSELLGSLVDSDTFAILRKMSFDERISAALGLDFASFERFFEPSPRDSLHHSRPVNSLNDNSIDKIIKILSNRKINSFVENQRLFCPKMFDRTFIVPFSSEKYEPLVQSNARSFLIKFNEARSTNYASFAIDGFICNVELTSG